MRKCDWVEMQKEHDSGKSLSFLMSEFKVSAGAINTAVKHGFFQKKKHKRHLSDEQKKKQSDSMKAWLIKNPDKHLWRKPDKHRSIPCSTLKKKLEDSGVVFVEEFMPLNDRLFSIDIAFPEKKIGIEVNGNQHYNKEDGKLKPYYQERHDLIEAVGWRLIELHFTMVYDSTVVSLLVNDLKREGVDVEVNPVKYEKLRLARIEECRRIKESRLLFFCSCGKKLFGKTKTGKCLKCSGFAARKAVRPSKNELEDLVTRLPMTRIGKMYGVSDNAVKKWCADYEIELGQRLGIWTKEIRSGTL